MFVVMGGLSSQLLSADHLFVNAERHRQQQGLPALRIRWTSKSWTSASGSL